MCCVSIVICILGEFVLFLCVVYLDMIWVLMVVLSGIEVFLEGCCVVFWGLFIWVFWICGCFDGSF